MDLADTGLPSLLHQSPWWSDHISVHSHYCMRLEATAENLRLGMDSIHPKAPQTMIWTSSRIGRARISVWLHSGTRHRATNTWFRYSLLQSYMFWINSKWLWLTLWYSDVTKGGNSFASYRSQKEEKETIAILKLICFKFSMFEVNTINANLNAVGPYPRSVFRFLDVLLQYTYWQLR